MLRHIKDSSWLDALIEMKTLRQEPAWFERNERAVNLNPFEIRLCLLRTGYQIDVIDHTFFDVLKM
ncbi:MULTISPECIES: hypothetical protein [unclassified Synechococcus]|jgi:hypothetical protein|uniref:hypothetical protein n=1 Tax=unclassified Synechococcus TaxID=2626047 RepID=UPI001CF80A1F|nr:MULTISPECIES: hypothetical protein [unclassified Synechococcus]MCB4377125.1 hypothetical protein [Synechococcus sp. MU1650]MCB4411055.1 hypothetical protein [Synechococcus sp. MU1611]